MKQLPRGHLICAGNFLYRLKPYLFLPGRFDVLVELVIEPGVGGKLLLGDLILFPKLSHPRL